MALTQTQIEGLLGQVSLQGLTETISALESGFVNHLGNVSRHCAALKSASPDVYLVEDVAEWIKQRFLQYGLEDVTTQEGTHNIGVVPIRTVPLINVLATIEGSTYPDQYIVVGAHHDSRPERVQTNTIIDGQAAPGADDNGTGVAALLEVARIIKNSGYVPEYSIQFCTFSAEEFARLGSWLYADTATANGMNIIGYLNLDMIGYTDQADPANQTILILHVAESESFHENVKSAIETYSDLVIAENTSLQLIQSMDSVAFHGQPVPIPFATISEHADGDGINPNYHTANDTLANLNTLCGLDYYTNMVRAVLASVASLSALGEVEIPYAASNAPPAITQLTGAANQMRLAWTAAVGATAYQVYVSYDNWQTREAFYTTDTELTIYNIPQNDDHAHAWVSVHSIATDGSSNASEVSEIDLYSSYVSADCGVTGIDHSSVRCSSDAQQFVFVDGREGTGAQRITIDAEGEIHCRRFGTEQPKTFPVIQAIENDKYRDQQYTGMPVGSILMYSYCVVNEYGERSNPSPIAVCDTAQWLAKGEYLDGEYQYSDVPAGSIKSVTVRCDIPAPDEAKRVELYRSSAAYCEDKGPREPLRLVTSKDIPAGTSVATLTDTAFASPVNIDYENDAAPAGDDIALESGTVFIANAVTESAFAYPVNKVWSITLTNKNDLNYVNRWFAIDIRGEMAAERCQFTGLPNTADLYNGNLYRFIDSDMITPLTAHGTGPYQTTATRQFTPFNTTGGTDTRHYWDIVYLQIPYVPAYSDTTIYLVEYSAPVTDYGTDVREIGTGDAPHMLDTWIANPVRDAACAIAMGYTAPPVSMTDSWHTFRGNKANALYAAEEDNFEQSATNTGTLQLLDFDNHVRSQSQVHTFDWFYQDTDDQDYDTAAIIHRSVDGMEAGTSGYFYTFVNVSRAYTQSGWQRIAMLKFGSRFISIDLNMGTKRLRVRLKKSDETLLSEWRNLIFTDHPDYDMASFLFFSWRKITTLDAEQRPQSKMEIKTGMINNFQLTNLLYYHGGAPQIKDKILTSMNTPQVKIMSNNYFPYQFPHGIGYWYFNIGEYIDDDYEIFALSRFDTHFPVEPIGIRDHSRHTDNYLDNHNVTIETLALANDKRPGRVRWSNGGAVPDLYEHNLYSEIVRIVPLKSFMPTDEHNTLLAWTKTDVLRLSLGGVNKELSSVITEFKGIGLQDPDSLVQVSDGVIWSERTGIYYLSPSGLKDIGRQRVNPGDYKLIYNPKEREVLFIDTSGLAKIYMLDWDAWSEIDYTYDIETLVEMDGVMHATSNQLQGTVTLEPVGDDTTLDPLILTRKIPARQKLNRITLHSSGGQVKAYVYNHRLPAGYTTTPTYTLGGDDPKAIPQLCGDYVQFEIVADTVNNFDIEDRTDGS